MARMNDVEIAPERLGVDDFYRSEFPFAELMCHGDLRKEAQPKLAFDHAFGSFNGFNFQDYVGQKAGAAEEALAERPIARATIVENQRPLFDFLQPRLSFARCFMGRMADENERVVAKGHRLDFGVI